MHILTGYLNLHVPVSGIHVYEFDINVNEELTPYLSWYIKFCFINSIHTCHIHVLYPVQIQ